jgi:hypothetical protein
MTNESYRWIIVAAAGLLGCVAIGRLYSLLVFIIPRSRKLVRNQTQPEPEDRPVITGGARPQLW